MEHSLDIPIGRTLFSIFILIIWGRCNLKLSRRTIIFLPVYKISSLKITPPKNPDSFRIRYRTLFHFYLKKNRLEFRFRSRDFSFHLFPVWQPYCWRFWSTIVPIHTSTINALELRERIKSFLPVEAEISVTKNFITANMKNYKVGATYNAPEEQ